MTPSALRHAASEPRRSRRSSAPLAAPPTVSIPAAVLVGLAGLFGLSGFAGCATDASPAPTGPRLSAADFGSPTTDSPRIIESTADPASPRASAPRLPENTLVSLGDPIPTPTEPTSTDQTNANSSRSPGSAAQASTPPTTRPIPTNATTLNDPRSPNPGAVQVRVGEPTLSPGSSEPVQVVLADAMVGDINGRPVYASAFFEDLDARFRAEALTLPRDEFLANAQTEIRRKLNEEIERELLRAEALASLPPQTREYGVSAFLDNLRTRVQRQGTRRFGGSDANFEQYVRATTGQSLDEYVTQQAERELVIFQFRSRIESRVNVTWREIRQEYERRFGEFNPDPVAVFRWIRVRTSNADDVAAVQQALDAGRPFAEVASLPINGYSPDVGGLFSREFTDPIEEASFFVLPEVNAAAVALEPGESAGPIESGRFTSWVMLDRIERLSSPLYDVQAVIAADRTQDLTSEELGRYVRRLRERASFTDVDEMTGRLLRIAAERYLPPREPAG